MGRLSIQDIEEIFNEHQETFTIYVVEFDFANDNGFEYFKKYRGTESYITSDSVLSKYLNVIFKWLSKNSPNLSQMVIDLFKNKKTAAIQDIIKIMSETFTTYNHQAVGPNVIDPIIIQEGIVDVKKITRLVSVHEYSIVQPTIIIILKDNYLERAEKMLSQCPHGICIKFVKNNLQHVYKKIINVGSQNLDAFIEAYTTQCFSTCSHTPRDIILNEELKQNSLIDYYTPEMFKIRSKFLYDHKNEVKNDLNILIDDIQSPHDNDMLRKSFLCLALLNRVFCNDNGGQDIFDALTLAKELDNDILLAHVYRYADFFPDISNKEQKNLLNIATKTFKKNGMHDHAIYSENNSLVLDFYEDRIDAKKYNDLAVRATTEVHGLVGTSHIQNNAGVAYLLTGNSEKAIELFKKGLAFAKKEDRTVQRLAIQTNLLIAKAYALEPIEQVELIRNMRQIFDALGTTELPYLSSNFVMNLLSLALNQSQNLYRELVNEFPVEKLLKTALSSNSMCSGQLILQMKILAQKYTAFTLLGYIDIPTKLSL